MTQAGKDGGGTVDVDLSGMVAEGRTDIHAIRYAWPLGDDGDTCWYVICSPHILSLQCQAVIRVLKPQTAQICITILIAD